MLTPQSVILAREIPAGSETAEVSFTEGTGERMDFEVAEAVVTAVHHRATPRSSPSQVPFIDLDVQTRVGSG